MWLGFQFVVYNVAKCFNTIYSQPHQPYGRLLSTPQSKNSLPDDFDRCDEDCLLERYMEPQEWVRKTYFYLETSLLGFHFGSPGGFAEARLQCHCAGVWTDRTAVPRGTFHTILQTAVRHGQGRTMD